MVFKVKLLIFNILQKPLMIRVFASEGRFVCKYALIFRGRVGNWGVKIKIRLQFESGPFCLFSIAENNVYSELRRPYFCINKCPLNCAERIYSEGNIKKRHGKKALRIQSDHHKYFCFLIKKTVFIVRINGCVNIFCIFIKTGWIALFLMNVFVFGRVFISLYS